MQRERAERIYRAVCGHPAPGVDVMAERLAAIERELDAAHLEDMNAGRRECAGMLEEVLPRVDAALASELGAWASWLPSWHASGPRADGDGGGRC